MFKVENEKQLTDLLKMISEEAVKFTKTQLQEKDPFDDHYQNLRNAEKKMLEEEEDPEETSAQGGSQEKQETEPSEKPKAATPPRPSDDKFTGSKDRLVDFVNDIRSAPSLKQDAVDEQVSAYYDRLSEQERDVLVFFLRELSRVMTGKASGSEARDPSDPPLNIDFVEKSKAQSAEVEKKQEPATSLTP